MRVTAEGWSEREPPSPERAAGPGSRTGSAGTGGKAGQRLALPASGHRRPLPRQRSPFCSRADGRGGNSLADSLQPPGYPRKSWLGYCPAANPPVGAKGYLGRKRQREGRLPPCPGSGGRLRTAFPHRLIPAHPSSCPVRGARSLRAQPGRGELPGASCVAPAAEPRITGARAELCPARLAFEGRRGGGSPRAWRGRRAGPAAARSAMKGSLTSTVHFPFLAAPANRERVVSAHVFLLQT